MEYLKKDHTFVFVVAAFTTKVLDTVDFVVVPEPGADFGFGRRLTAFIAYVGFESSAVSRSGGGFRVGLTFAVFAGFWLAFVAGFWLAFAVFAGFWLAFVAGFAVI
jgi:hypothetical protein